MKLGIATRNKVKIEALREAIAEYDFLKTASIEIVDAVSNVSDQPKSLEETVAGARNRAKFAFQNNDLGFGVEDGLMAVPQSLTGFMNVCVCAIFDGDRFCLGLSPAFEYPPAVADLVFKKDMDVNQAYYSLGFTDDQNIGSSQGAIGILTKGRWNRKMTAKWAIEAALIQIDNKKLYL